MFKVIYIRSFGMLFFIVHSSCPDLLCDKKCRSWNGHFWRFPQLFFQISENKHRNCLKMILNGFFRSFLHFSMQIVTLFLWEILMSVEMCELRTHNLNIAIIPIIWNKLSSNWHSETRRSSQIHFVYCDHTLTECLQRICKQIETFEMCRQIRL